MKIRADMHFKDAYTCDEEYIVERAIMIRPSEFSYMCKHLSEDNRYIEDNLDSMYCDDNNKIHCLLLINDDTGDGLLINSEGNYYARYCAVIPNAKLLWDMSRYPSLQNYNERIIAATDKIISKALTESNECNFIENTADYDDDFQLSTLESMLVDTGFVEASHVDLDVIDIIMKKNINEQGELKIRVIDQKEFDIMVAKNMLWINDAGGEQLDLSNCILKDLNMQGRCMLGADLKNAQFINCDMQNSELCFAMCRNAKFHNCNMERAVAEECDFSNAEFSDCTCDYVAFTHSNFTNARFKSTDVVGTIFTNSCMEGVISSQTDFNTSNRRNVCYDEQEWNQDDATPALSM